MCLKRTLKRALFLLYTLIAMPYAVLGMHAQSHHQNGQDASEVEYLQQECERLAPFFLEAIMKDDVDTMHRMVRHCPPLVTYGILKADWYVGYKGKDNTIPICVAAREGALGALQFLFDNNAPLQADELYDYSALNSAAVAGQCETVRWLLRKRADTRGLRGYHALCLAALGGYLDIIRLLLERDVDEKWCSHALGSAAQGGHLYVVRELVEKYSADVNLPDGHNRETPLHRASKCGHTGVVEYLLRNEADVNALNHCEAASLHLAAHSGHASVVRHLLDNGAQMNTTGLVTSAYLTPLQQAILGNKSHGRGLPVFKELLRRGATLDGQHTDERELLNTVMIWGDSRGKSILRYLLTELGLDTQLPVFSRVELLRFMVEFGVPITEEYEIALLKRVQAKHLKNPDSPYGFDVRAVIQNQRREIEDALLGAAPRVSDGMQTGMSRLAPSTRLPHMLTQAVESSGMRSDVRGEKPAMLQNVPDDVIKLIIECMVTPDLPALEEVNGDS